jgi:hypothetical protein
VFLIHFPLAFEKVARRVVIHLSIALFHVVLETSLEDTSAFEDDLSLPVLLTIKPISFIGRIINRVFACPMSQAIFDVSFVCTAIGPFVGSLPCNTIISKFSLVDDAVCPFEFSFTV